ncbi:hypothetical protein H2200_002922 [Cladophialophora chaetospira]|uniref:U3 snoRNA-associated protein 11 n=1 Tax=Cladophialophora chaetospira TaxID=386627 RepID=A0AA39CM65_9EURO|nr:hypothetical protein H2200_002922 [Cladophialophora chaetospira]
MSSMRNAVTRRPHKERSQPEGRSKWGLLEKKKDYSLRAADFNKKRAKLGLLAQKARERNPDEFAFGMVSSGRAGLGKHKPTHDGEEAGKGKEGTLAAGKPLSHDAVRLLKTQDAGYLRTVAAKGRREIERLGEQVGLDGVAGGKVVSRKTTFEDEVAADAIVSRGTKRKSNGRPISHEEDISMEVVEVATATDLADEDESPKPTAKSRKALKAEQDTLTRLKAERKKRKRLQEMRVAKLDALKKRQREILAAADQLEQQRAKMARTVGGVNKEGIRFKIRERKR